MGEVYLVRHPRLPPVRGAQGSRTTSVRIPGIAGASSGGRCCCRLRHPSIVRVLDRGRGRRPAVDLPGIRRRPRPQRTRRYRSAAWPPHRPHHRADRARIGRRRRTRPDPPRRQTGEISSSTPTARRSSSTSASRTRTTRTPCSPAPGSRLAPSHFRAAPEQLQGLDVDSRTDQYALGCTAFALLTGTHVYVGNSAAAIAIAHVKDPIPFATQTMPRGGCRPPWTRC